MKTIPLQELIAKDFNDTISECVSYKHTFIQDNTIYWFLGDLLYFQHHTYAPHIEPRTVLLVSRYYLNAIKINFGVAKGKYLWQILIPEVEKRLSNTGNVSVKFLGNHNLYLGEHLRAQGLLKKISAEERFVTAPTANEVQPKNNLHRLYPLTIDEVFSATKAAEAWRHQRQSPQKPLSKESGMILSLFEEIEELRAYKEEKEQEQMRLHNLADLITGNYERDHSPEERLRSYIRIKSINSKR